MWVSQACLCECGMSSGLFGTLTFLILNTYIATYINPPQTSCTSFASCFSKWCHHSGVCMKHLNINFNFSLSVTHTTIVLYQFYYPVISVLCPMNKIYHFISINISSQTTLCLLWVLGLSPNFFPPFVSLVHLHFNLMKSEWSFVTQILSGYECHAIILLKILQCLPMVFR